MFLSGKSIMFNKNFVVEYFLALVLFSEGRQVDVISYTKKNIEDPKYKNGNQVLICCKKYYV